MEPIKVGDYVKCTCGPGCHARGEVREIITKNNLVLLTTGNTLALSNTKKLSKLEHVLK